MTLHMYMGVTFPLVLQSIMMPLNLKSGALVKFIEQRDQAERMKMKMDLKREKKALKKKSKG
eukprot:gene30089-7352_t